MCRPAAAGRWLEPPRVGTGRCWALPVFVSAVPGHMTVNLRRRLPTPSARRLGTPRTPKPSQLRPLGHPEHVEQPPSSHHLRIPLGPHSAPQLCSSGSNTHNPMAQPVPALGLSPRCLREEAGRSHSSLFPTKKHPGHPPPLTPLGAALSSPRSCLEGRCQGHPQSREHGWPLGHPHPHKAPREQEGVGVWWGTAEAALAGGRAAGSWRAADLGSWHTGLIPSVVPQGSALVGTGA